MICGDMPTRRSAVAGLVMQGNVYGHEPSYWVESPLLRAKGLPVRHRRAGGRKRLRILRLAMNTTELQPASAERRYRQPFSAFFMRLRGLLHHVREWGDPAKPITAARALPLAGRLGNLPDAHRALAGRLATYWPPFTGVEFSHSQWPVDGYWFQDYVADLDGLVSALSRRTRRWCWSVGSMARRS